MTDYWEEEGSTFETTTKDDDDDDNQGPGVISKSLSLPDGGPDLESKGTHLNRALGADEDHLDYQSLVLGGELVNCHVDRQKLADNSFMRFVTKIASTNPAKGREKRVLVFSASNELPLHVASSSSVNDFTEIARTDTSYDSPNCTFALPVKLQCRKGTDRMIRIQLIWSQSNVVVGGETTILGQLVERFSELHRKTVNLQPLSFNMTSPACVKGRALLWALPIGRISHPHSPYVALAPRHHVSYSVPFLFRREEDGPTAAGLSDNKLRSANASLPSSKEATKKKELAEDVVLGAQDLLVTKETALESRFSYQLASLIFRPLIMELETALESWDRRLEYERRVQGFNEEEEGSNLGGVLVTLSVLQAVDIPLISSKDGHERGEEVEARRWRGAAGGDFCGISKAKNAPRILPSVPQQAQTAFAQKLNLNKGSEKPTVIHANPFVAVILEKPNPEMNVLIGHSNTEYSTQSPIFASNSNIKACPHNKPRDTFTVSGKSRLVSPATFSFNARREEIDHRHLIFEVFHEAFSLPSGLSTQYAASASVLLDSQYLTSSSSSSSSSTEGTEIWLPLIDREGVAAGRLLVRLALTACSTITTTSSEDHLPDLSLSDSYRWMAQMGFSGVSPREADLFSSEPWPIPFDQCVRAHYPLDWLQMHIDSLRKDLELLQRSLAIWEKAVRDGYGFRSSDHKMTLELQGVATNVHSQTLVITDAQSLAAEGGGGGGGGNLMASQQTVENDLLKKKHYYDLVSTGAPTAHALGFRRGGLLTHHLDLKKLQREILQLDQALITAASANSHGFHPTGNTGELYGNLLSKLLTFEAISAKTAIRRALILSQALAIATTSVASKLDIMLTEDADQSLLKVTAENMAKGGYLLCYQGLVSTIGKEHGMLEDAAAAMELASRYSFKIQPKQCSSHEPVAATSTDLLFDFACPSPPRPERDLTSNATELEVDFDPKLKQILLLVDPTAYQRLPAALKQHAGGGGGGVFPIVSILFAQGIDVRQSFANFSNQLKTEQGPADTTIEGVKQGSKKVGGDSTIQPIINRRSLKILNDYCHRCYPVVSPSDARQDLLLDVAPTNAVVVERRFDRFQDRYENSKKTMTYGSEDEFARSIDEIQIHPMLEVLRNSLKRDNGNHKNVELLREQERVVLEVGGGQVIFCKSGKDRTGMAVTLLQSRILGERHGCGNSTERLIRDANVMRLNGTRLLICDKNVGRLKYAFNSLQLQFMPSEYRPPNEAIEDMVDSILNRDTT